MNISTTAKLADYIKTLDLSAEIEIVRPGTFVICIHAGTKMTAMTVTQGTEVSSLNSPSITVRLSLMMISRKVLVRIGEEQKRAKTRKF